MLRVGTCTYNEKRKMIYPSYDNFTPILVMTRNHSNYFPLGPYDLKDDRGRIMENIWQFSKCYRTVPKITQKFWNHSTETHLDENDELTEEYLQWREKGMNHYHYVRYPVGLYHRHHCQFALAENIDGSINMTKLDYIQSRKAIYLPVYCELAKKEVLFTELQTRLADGENLLIIEVDGPHQESMDYYKNTYNVDDDFIVDNTILVTEANIQIMLNDSRHPFGHGYCLAMALAGKDIEWNI